MAAHDHRISAGDYEAFNRFKDTRKSFATVELTEEKASAISASRMDARHAHLDTMLDERTDRQSE
jgi:hypothetical protein